MSQSKLIPETERAKYTKDPPDGILYENCFTSKYSNGEGIEDGDAVGIGGLTWGLAVKKKSLNDNEFVYVNLVDISNSLPPWNIEITAEYIVLHGSDPSKNVSQMHHYVLRDLDYLTENGCYLMHWQEFVDKKKGFSGVVQIRLTIMHGLRCNPSFDFSSPGDIQADVILKVEGKPVHVNKQYLGLYSPVFYAMFFGDSAEKEKDEIELKDVDYEVFIELLHVIYPSRKCVTESRAEGLIKLADRFQITSVIQEAVETLIVLGDGGSSSTDKIRIGAEYNLFKLSEAGLSEITCIDEAQEVMDDPCYENLSDATKAALLERICNKRKRRSQCQPRLIPETERAKFTRNPPDGIIEVKFYVRTISFNNASETEEVEIRGLQWQLGVAKRSLNEKEFLFLSLIPEFFKSPPWNVELTAEFIIHHSTDSDKNVSQMLHYVLRHDFTELHGCYEDENNPEPAGCYLIPWMEIMDEKKGFIQNEDISVEVRLTILKGLRCNRVSFDFSPPGDNRSDVVLLIEGKAVHVNKQYLSLYSSFFQSMFFGDFAEKDKNEIELKDVNYEEFIELLHVIYPSQKRITDTSAEYLIVLADRFQITSVIHRAEYALVKSWRHTPVKKMRIAHQYNLYELMGETLTALEKVEDVQAIKNDPIYKGLSETTKISLRERERKLAELRSRSINRR